MSGKIARNQRLDPDTETGAVLLDFLSDNPDLDVQRRVAAITSRLSGRPAGKPERNPSFLDVQRTLAKMRDDMSLGIASVDVQYQRADLEEAMHKLDPRFRLVQKQWGQDENLHSAALAGQAAWTGKRFADRIKIDMHRLADDPDAQRAYTCLLYTSPSPRDRTRSRMPSSA